MILVDDLFYVGSSGKLTGRWCHMVSNESVDELISFAKKIGLREEWLQTSVVHHFDLRPSKRRMAIHHGAREVSRKTLVIEGKKAKARKANT